MLRIAYRVKQFVSALAASVQPMDVILLPRYLSAAEAYRRAAELDTSNATLRSLQGEALVAAAKGEVTQEALKTFKTALELDQNDVRARFYSGQADLQNGNTKAALDTWIALLVSAPKGAEWSTDLRERIVEVAQQSGIDIIRALTAPGLFNDDGDERHAGVLSTIRRLLR